MKKHILAALALSMLATPVFAEDAPPAGAPTGEHKGPPPGGRHGGPGGPGGDFMEKVDTDKDGKISRAEFQVKGDEMFKEADANGDGFITKEEGKAAHEARRAKWKEKRAEFQKNNAAKEE